MMKLKKFLPYLIGIIVFILIIININLRQVFNSIRNIDLFYLILALLIFFPLLIIKNIKWRYLLKIQKIDYPFFDSLLIYMASMFIGFATPGRLGDFSRVIYMKKENVSVGRAFFSTFFDRLSDVIILLFIGSISILYFSYRFGLNLVFLPLAIALALIILVVLLIKNNLLIRIVKFLLEKFVPMKYKSKVRLSFDDFIEDLKSLRLKNYIAIFAMTFLIWMLYFFQIYLLSFSLKIPISYITLSLCISLVSILSMIPISIYNIGTRDIALVYLFSLLGISSESAISLSMLILFHIFYSSIIGIFAYFKKPIYSLKNENIFKPNNSVINREEFNNETNE